MRALVVLAALITLVPAAVSAKGPKAANQAAVTCTQVTNLKEVKLKRGINDLDGTPGEAGLKVLWLRKEGNFVPENYNAYVVFLGSISQGGTIFRFKNPATNEFEDTIRDNPYDGEMHIRSVAFAHGTCNKINSVFLVSATKILGSGPAEATKVAFEIFGIHGDDYGFDAWFERVSARTSEQKYDSAEEALIKEYGFSMGR